MNEDYRQRSFLCSKPPRSIELRDLQWTYSFNYRLWAYLVNCVLHIILANNEEYRHSR